MAKKSDKDGDRKSGRANYAPEWITKSIDKVPPSDEPLADNPVVDAILGVHKPSGNGVGESGGAEPSPDKGSSST